jgi:hypothetical protein
MAGEGLERCSIRIGFGLRSPQRISGRSRGDGQEMTGIVMDRCRIEEGDEGDFADYPGDSCLSFLKEGSSAFSRFVQAVRLTHGRAADQ